MPCTGKRHAEPMMRLFLALLLAALLLPASTAQAEGTAAGTSITNTASATYKDSSSNEFTATSNETTVDVTEVYTVTVSTPGDQSGNTPSVVYYAYTVTNTGNAANTFALSAASVAGGNAWSVALYYDANGDGTHQAGETTVTASTGALAADATYRFFVAVTIPSSVANGQTDDTILSVTGSGDAGAGDDATDTVTTTVTAPALSITKAVRLYPSGTFDTTASAAPDNVLEYRITVTNNGSISADNIVLTDADNAYTTYEAGTMYIGSNGTTSNGAGNVLQDDDSNAGGIPCASDACGHSSVSGGTVTAYLGTGATESAGDSRSFAPSSTVYVYFRVKVD